MPFHATREKNPKKEILDIIWSHHITIVVNKFNHSPPSKILSSISHEKRKRHFYSSYVDDCIVSIRVRFSIPFVIILLESAHNVSLHVHIHTLTQRPEIQVVPSIRQ